MLSAVEQSLLDRASVEKSWQLLEEITSFKREHPNDVDRSVEIVAEKLRADGLPAEVATMDLYLSLPGEGRVEANGQSFRAKPSAMSVPAPEGLSGELLYVPGTKDMIASLLDPSQDVGGLRDRIAGRIVLLEGIAGPGVVSSFAPLGAIAVIAINPGQDIHSAICTPIWGNPDLRSIDKKPTIPVVAVNKPDGEALRALGDGVEVTLFSALEEDWFPSKYVALEIPGTAEADKWVMLHGHIDSWDVGVGDNGTGVVTMYEVARMLWEQRGDLKRSVRVIWWPGHSTGRYAGSTWYADNFATDIFENCVAQIDCDSPGCRWATAYLEVFCMPEATAFLNDAIRDATGKNSEMMRPFRAADWSFNNIGVTGLLALSSTMPPELVAEKGYYRVGGNGGNIEWHTERDRMEVADKDILLIDTKLYALATFRVAAADVLPFDFRPAVAEYRETLQRYQESAGDRFDLKPAVEAAEELAQAVDGFYAAVEGGGVTPELANETIVALERALVPAHFASEGRYQQDPALDTPPLTSIALASRLDRLDASKLPFAATQLLRGRNQIVAAFREATRAARRALQ
jgi:N-acetylated-alpha-linked acidic dipeptidase